VVIDIYGEYTHTTNISKGRKIKSTIQALYSVEGHLEEVNGLYTIYIASVLPFATKRVLSQKLGSNAAEALLWASNEQSLCTVTGGIKVMDKLLRG